MRHRRVHDGRTDAVHAATPAARVSHDDSLASRISFVTASGCVTIDRWLVLSSTVVAFMRLARKRSSSGDAVLSCVETAYRVGLLRHAATVVLPENSEVEMGPWAA